MKKILSFLIPIVIAIFVTITTNELLDKKLSVLIQQKDVSQMGKKFSDVVKDQSVITKNILSSNGDLFMLGSSEMGVDVPQNALELFPVNGSGYAVSCFGRAYSQDLQQATYLGSGNLQDNQKVAYILSLQWFEDANGIQPYNFAVNFSDVQFYSFLENPKISEENKKYYAGRVYEFLTEAKKYPAEALYAKLYLNENNFNKGIKLLLEPYYKSKQYLLKIKDKALIYKKLSKLPDKTDKKPNYINWENEHSRINKQNENVTYNNEFHLNDKYYNSQIKDKVSQFKDQSASEDLMNSKEMNDYKFFLSVCNELNIKPYIILPAVNGWYYDYVGLSKEKRDEYYKTVEKMAEDNGFEVLNLHQYDYKEGFLVDAKHLGKEGWLKVSEEIYKHFDKK